MESNVALQNADFGIPPGHYGLLASYADAFVSGGPVPSHTWTQLNDGTGAELADFFILDVRAVSAFNARHLAEAFNAPFALLAKPWNLAQLPIDKPILVVCKTGQTSATQAAAILGMLGYDARILTGGMDAVPPM